MAKDDLSPREAAIVELAAEGLTNDAIANQLGLSIGTVNTYWLRIKLKTGGQGRTDTVLGIFKKRHELALKQERVDWAALSSILEKREILDVIAEKARGVELRTRLAMLQLAMDFNLSCAWATADDLRIHFLTNGGLPSGRSGVTWQDGKTIYEVFQTQDKAHPAIAAHLAALAGTPRQVPLCDAYADMMLKVVPVRDDAEEVICCISILMSATDT